MVLEALLKAQVKLQASDLHIMTNMKPRMRGPEGGLYEIEEYDTMNKEEIEEMVQYMIGRSAWEQFLESREYDGNFHLPGIAHFRVNLAYDMQGIRIVFRYIPDQIRTIEELGLPKVMYRFTENTAGMFLVTGQGNSGKTTTLASLIETMNQNYHYHILTIEDPIEYVFKNKKSLITQRNVGTHTKTFPDALKHALRQNPDVIVVGEMRDLESISAALTLAETGHLVFATLHTQNVPSTIERIVNSFPGSQREQVRMQLSLALRGILCQQLVPKKDGTGRALAYELAFANNAIRAHIKEGTLNQIYNVITANQDKGMQTFEASLLELYKQGLITKEEVLFRVNDPEEVAQKLL
jgi:twitching motility protein PilT